VRRRRTFSRDDGHRHPVFESLTGSFLAINRRQNFGLGHVPIPLRHVRDISEDGENLFRRLLEHDRSRVGGAFGKGHAGDKQQHGHEDDEAENTKNPFHGVG